MADGLEQPPERLADFEVIRRLGAGGMAEVFLAKKRGAEGTYKLLVVKRILPAHDSSRRFRAMFAEEAQLATRLNHPNIVQVYDFQDYGDEGQLLSMEYVEGPDLKKLQRAARSKKTRLAPFISAFVISEVAKGLHYAHERTDEGGRPLEIVHRDVSPQNILLSFDGAVKIADFGIATANLFRDEPGVLKGKTAYMSPEQARGERVDRRSDVYSLGVVLHELLTGRPLHGAADGPELLEAVRAGNVEPPSASAAEVPPELEAIAMRALSRDREDRFQTARDMASAITRVLFQKQELVDSHVLELAIADLVSREHTSPGFQAPEPRSDGAATGSRLDSVADKRVGTSSVYEEKSTGTGRPVRGLRAREGREVRHVAVITIRLHGLEQLSEKLGAGPSARFTTQLRAIFDNLAFKRGGRWSWQTQAAAPGEPAAIDWARAVVGLLANPARAAADAATLAIDVHDTIQGACDDLGVKLTASVGIVRGIATGRRDEAGHLINHTLQYPAEYLADLLSDQAAPGQTWVAGGLYRLVRRDFVWGDAPTIQIDAAERNLPRNMRLYALERPLTRDEKVQQMSLAPRDLIGRDAELADLHAAYHRAVTPRKGHNGQVTGRVVVGELGIGKSALVSTFLAELPPDARVVRIECSPVRSELPYFTVGQFVREFTGTRLDQPLAEATSLVAQALGDFAGGRHREEMINRLAQLTTGRLAEAQDEADVQHNRRLISSGIRRFFARAAVEAPLVVMLDGVQWCDRTSLELLTGLVQRADPLPILALLVARPDDRLAAMLEGIVRLELRGLSAENQIRLIQAHVGATHGVAQVCADLVPRAAGNPFFLLEMVDALLERGALEVRDVEGKPDTHRLVRSDKADDRELPLPSTLEQLIADRLNELPPEEHLIVTWLAVSGGPLGVSDLESLAEGGETADYVVRLCARGLCDQREDVVDVRHPLTRDVAYMAVDKPERERMHRALGQHLKTTKLAHGLNAAIVARHLARGGEKEEAAQFYAEAATSARNGYQLQLATRFYRRVLGLLAESDTRRLEAYEALENIARIQGKWRDRRRYLDALRKLARRGERPLWVATALVRSARFDLDAGRLARGLTLAQKGELAARQAHSSRLEVEAQSLMAEMLRDLGDMQGALAACDRALETTTASPVPARLRAEVLRARGTLLLRVGRVQEAVQAHAEAIAVFRKVGARRQEARARNSLAFAMFVLGRFEDAIALGLEAIRIDLAIGGRFQIAKTLSNIGQSYARLGDLPRALAYFRRAREAHHRYGDQDGRADTLLASAEVLIDSGDIEEAEELVGDASALNAVTGSAYDSVHEKILRALLARSAGDSGSAVMHAFDARQVAEAQAYVAFHFYAMAIESMARVEIGEHHTGILLATTAMGAIETIQGSEYGLETRALCCEAIEMAGSPQAPEMQERAARHAERLLETIRDAELKRGFRERPLVKMLLSDVQSADVS